MRPGIGGAIEDVAPLDMDDGGAALIDEGSVSAPRLFHRCPPTPFISCPIAAAALDAKNFKPLGAGARGIVYMGCTVCSSRKIEARFQLVRQSKR